MRYLPVLASFIALASCGSDECPLPREWIVASSLKPSPVPYTPKVVFYAQELDQGPMALARKEHPL